MKSYSQTAKYLKKNANYTKYQQFQEKTFSSSSFCFSQVQAPRSYDLNLFSLSLSLGFNSRLSQSVSLPLTTIPASFS